MQMKGDWERYIFFMTWFTRDYLHSYPAYSDGYLFKVELGFLSRAGMFEYVLCAESHDVKAHIAMTSLSMLDPTFNFQWNPQLCQLLYPPRAYYLTGISYW